MTLMGEYTKKKVAEITYPLPNLCQPRLVEMVSGVRNRGPFY